MQLAANTNEKVFYDDMTSLMDDRHTCYQDRHNFPVIGSFFESLSLITSYVFIRSEWCYYKNK